MSKLPFPNENPERSEKIPEDLLEFEFELAKLSPLRLQEKRTSRPSGFEYPDSAGKKQKSPKTQILTLCVGILIGAVLGGGSVYYFLRFPGDFQQAVEFPDPVPQISGQNTKKETETLPSDPEPPVPVLAANSGNTSRSQGIPLDPVDRDAALIEAYLLRNEMFAKFAISHPVSTSVSRDASLKFEPDSLLYLRKRMEL